MAMSFRPAIAANACRKSSTFPQWMTRCYHERVLSSFITSCRNRHRRWYNVEILVPIRTIAATLATTIPTSKRYFSSTFKQANDANVVSVEQESAFPVVNDSTPISSESGLFRLLSDQQRSLLDELHALNRRSLDLCSLLMHDVEDGENNLINMNDSAMSGMNRVAKAALQRNSAFCLLFAGEFNAGKSTIINALLGEKLLETGPIPTTDCITMVSSSSSSQSPNFPLEANSEEYASSSLVKIHQVPYHLDLLNDLTIVDTPGTNAVWLDHTQTTLQLLPSADMIVFVTSADRPLAETERNLLKDIVSAYRKPVLLVINKMDLLDMSGGDHGAQEKQRVVDFVRHHSHSLLSTSFSYDGGGMVIAISARDALAAKILHRQQSKLNNPSSTTTEATTDASSSSSSLQESPLWRRSNFAALEQYLQQTLTADTKIRSKLMSPLGETERLANVCLQLLQKRQKRIAQDSSTLQLVQSQLNGWRNILVQQVRAQAQRDLLQPLEEEGQRVMLLLQRLSLSSPFHFYKCCLLDSTLLQREWDATQTTSYNSPATTTNPNTTISPLHETMEARAKEIADSVATQGRAQGQAMIEFLGSRPMSSRSNVSLVGNVLAASTFEETKQSLTESLLHAIARHVHHRSLTEQRTFHGQILSLLQRRAYTAVALVSAAVTTVAFGNALDVTGIAGPTTVGLLALAWTIHHYGPTTIARDWQRSFQRQRDDLSRALDSILERNLERVDQRIRNGILPYTNFVQAEQDRISAHSADAKEILFQTERLKKLIHSNHDHSKNTTTSLSTERD